MSFFAKMMGGGGMAREERIAQQKQLRELEEAQHIQRGITAERDARTRLAERRQASIKTGGYRRGMLAYAPEDDLAVKLG